MKKLDIEIFMRESFYEESASPMLPIPFSSEDMKQITGEGILISVIAENLLQMIDQFPERIRNYTSLIIYCCLNAGSEAAAQNDFMLSNHYFLLASDFAPDDVEVRQKLARSYQYMERYQDAIDNFLFVLKNINQNKNGFFESTVCLIESYYAVGEKESARKLAVQLMKNINVLEPEAREIPHMLIKKILLEDKADQELWLYFFEN